VPPLVDAYVQICFSVGGNLRPSRSSFLFHLTRSLSRLVSLFWLFFPACPRTLRSSLSFSRRHRIVSVYHYATRSDSYSSRVGARRICHPHQREHPPRRFVSLPSTCCSTSDDDAPLPSWKRWASPRLRFIDLSPDLVSLSRNPVHSHYRRKANEITSKRYIVRYCGMKISKGSVSVKAIDNALKWKKCPLWSYARTHLEKKFAITRWTLFKSLFKIKTVHGNSTDKTQGQRHPTDDEMLV